MPCAGDSFATDWRPTPEGGLLYAFPATSPQAEALTLFASKNSSNRSNRLLLELDDDEDDQPNCQPRPRRRKRGGDPQSPRCPTRSKGAPDRLLPLTSNLLCRSMANRSMTPSPKRVACLLSGKAPVIA